MTVVSADPAVRIDRHSCELITGDEHALEVSAEFVAAGLRSRERVTVVGLTVPQQEALLTRLRQDGAEPADAVRRGQLVVLDETRLRALYAMPSTHLASRLGDQAGAALRDGFTGIRFGGLLVGRQLSPHEATLNALVREFPARALCLYDSQAPEHVLQQVRRMHDSVVKSTALYDDGVLRIRALSPHAVRISGRIHPGNRTAVLAALTEAARTGRRTIDAVSLREVDPESLYAVLTAGLGLTLRRPHPVVRHLARGLATRLPPPPETDPAARTGTPIAGQTAAEAATNLIWRTFGPARPGRPRSVLDWAGLVGHPAAPVAEVADRHGIAPGTLTNRVRQVRSRGIATQLTPLLIRDATRRVLPSEDHLSRQRIAHLFGLAGPRP